MKSDYERLMKDLEQVAQRLADLNVAGIAPGICDDITAVTIDVLRIKHKVRWIGGREKEA